MKLTPAHTRPEPEPNSFRSGSTVHRMSGSPRRPSRLASIGLGLLSVRHTDVNRMNAPGLAATSLECQLPKASRATAMHEARVLQVLHRGPFTDTHPTSVCGRSLLRARLLTRRRLLGASLDHDRRKRRTRRKRHRSGERQE